MNDYLLSVLLGIVEGLTEFLPVSSTAHLRISEVLLHVPLSSGYWKMYSIVIQLGAILVLPIYFRQHIAKLFSTFPEGEKGDCDYLTHPLSLVMIAFVVTAGPSYLLTKVIGKSLESLYVMGASLLIGGIVMWVVDGLYGKGHVVMFSINPMWRGETQGTYSLVLNTVMNFDSLNAGRKNDEK